MRTYKYKTKSQAKKKQKSIKKKYGYTPTIFKEKCLRTGATKYVVVEPRGLRRVRRTRGRGPLFAITETAVAGMQAGVTLGIGKAAMGMFD